jgi:hypothetical protein
MSLNVHRAGYLIKQGDVIRSWRKRWFVLSDDALHYFKDESQTLVKGLIALASIRSVAPVANRDKRSARAATFVIATGDRDWLIQADSEASRDAWVDAINRMLALAKQRPPTAGAAARPSASLSASGGAKAGATLRPPVVDHDDDNNSSSSDIDDGAAPVSDTFSDVFSDAPANSDSDKAASERPTPTETSQYVELPCVREVDEILARAQAAELETGRITSQYGLSRRVPLVESDDDDDDNDNDEEDGGGGGGGSSSAVEPVPDLTPADPMLDVPAERGPSLLLTKGRTRGTECAKCKLRVTTPCFTLGARTLCEPCAVDEL